MRVMSLKLPAEKPTWSCARGSWMYAEETTCASWLVSAIMRSWCCGVVNTTRPKPRPAKNFSSMSSGPRPQEGYGVRIIEALRKRSADALSQPLVSLPAIGCPPTNVQRSWKAYFSSAAQMVPFTPVASTTTAPFPNVAWCASIHGTTAAGGRATMTMSHAPMSSSSTACATPSATALSAVARVRFHTSTLWPACAAVFANDPPINPNPMTPTFTLPITSF